MNPVKSSLQFRDTGSEVANLQDALLDLLDNGDFQLSDANLPEVNERATQSNVTTIKQKSE